MERDIYKYIPWSLGGHIVHQFALNSELILSRDFRATEASITPDSDLSADERKR